MHNDPANLRDLWGLTASDSQAAGGSKETTEETVSNPDTNRTSRKGVDINYFPKDEKIYKYAKKVENPVDDDVFDVGGHGAPFFMVDDTGNRISADKLAETIKADANYQEGMTVRLLSCSTGKYSDGFAQELADEMGAGATVMAPSKTLNIYSDGSLKIYDTSINSDGKEEIEEGEWKTFIGKEK